MTFTTAVAGKGGTGKTTVTGLIVQSLLRREAGPILAVDADPNATLAELLGLEVEMTVGSLQAETLRNIHDLPAGVPLSRHMEYELHQALVEGAGIDLLVMGRGEGSGCYCTVNHILHRYFESIRTNYPYVILDNEAGMEHLSRRVSEGVDLLLIVTDPNPVAVSSAARINALANELELDIGKRFLVLNRVRKDVPEQVSEQIASTGLELLARIPFDEDVAELSLQGLPFDKLKQTSTALIATEKMLEKALIKEEET